MDKEREEILDRMGRSAYAHNEFLRSIFDTVEDYLDEKPSKDFPCRDCGKIIKYSAIYGCTCKECNWQLRLANY